MATERSVLRIVETTDVVVDDVFAATLGELAAEAAADPGGVTERRLRVLASALPLVVCVADARGDFTHFYGGAVHRLAATEAEMVGTNLTELGDLAVELLAQVTTDGAIAADIDGTTDGSAWSFKVYVAPGPDGSAIGVAVDTTDHVSAARSARDHESLYETTVDALDEGIVVQKIDGTIVTVNSKAMQLAGMPEDEVVGASASDRRWPVVREDLSPFPDDERPSATALRTGEAVRDVITGVHTVGAGFRWLRVSAYPITLAGERAVVTSFVDVTEQREMIEALRDSEERFRNLTESSPIGIFITDPRGRMQYVNPEASRQAGRGLDDLQRIGPLALIHPDDRDEVAEAQRSFLEEGAPYLQEHRLVRPDGSICWVRVRLARMTDEGGAVIGVVGTSADISDFVLADQRLRESEERTRAIIETAAEGIVTSDGDGTIIEFNAAAERMFGYDSDEVVGRMHFEELVAEPQRQVLVGYFRDYLGGAEPRVVGQPAIEVELEHRDGSTITAEMALTEVYTSEGRLFTAVLHDISERKAFELELEHQATHDALTGLPNRALLVAELEAALNRAARRHSSVGVLFVELGRLKLVTDSLGHRAGDQVIIEAAHRLGAVVDRAATVTRFGGNHLVVFCEDLDDVGEAVEIATQIIETIERPFLLGTEEAFVRAAVGVSFAPHGASTAESLISNADVAMNRARVAAGSGFEVFDAEMRAWVDARRKLEIAMRHGIDRDEFELYYQPVIAVGTGRIAGFEALVRWNHPELGLLTPAEFIPLAEDSGLIVGLGEWILRSGCRQLARWQERFADRDLHVSVNLSGVQLALADLATTVSHALKEAGADASRLELEITETVLLDDVERAAQTLDELKQIGVKLAMDDFGTGYSSLTYLCRFPIDIVKVDRSFVSQIGMGTRDASVVSLVVGLAQTLQLDVVAEGVETIEQLTALEDLDCEFAQGYLFSRPVQVAEAEELLNRPSL